MSLLPLIFGAIALSQSGAAPSPAPQPTAPALPPMTTPPYDVTILNGAVLSPECGGLYGLQGRAFCVTAPLVQVGALADAYIADLQTKGWLVAAGEANRVVFVRRKADQTCEGLQMQAFYDTAAAATPTRAGFLGFGLVPGDICAGQPAGTTAP